MPKKAGAKGKSSPTNGADVEPIGGKPAADEPKTKTRIKKPPTKPVKPAAAPKPTPKPTPVADPSPPSDLWENDLRVNERGKADGTPYKQSFGNVQIILSNHPLWKGLWAFDEFIGDVVTTREPQWDTNAPPRRLSAGGFGEWTERDTSRLRGWLDREYGIDVGPTVLGQAIQVVAEEYRVHAVRTYLSALQWDQKPRLDTWLNRICGTPDTQYARTVGSKFLIGAVARVMTRPNHFDPGGPGCKLDSMPVFEGKTGVGKSTAAAVLFSAPLFSDTHFEIGNKDGYQVLRAKWGYEFGELSQLGKADMHKIKNFLSSQVDRYRPSYAATTQDFKRQAVFIGTTEDDQWHKDDRGGRRFWPIRVLGVGPHKKVDLVKLRAERDQLWAEAVARFLDGETWYLDTPEIAELAAAEIDLRRQVDPWEEKVADWIVGNERGYQLKARENPGTVARRYIVSGVSTSDVLDMLPVSVGSRSKADEMQAGSVLRGLGWARGDGGPRAAHDRYKYWPNKVEYKRIEETAADLIKATEIAKQKGTTSGTPPTNGGGKLVSFPLKGRSTER